MTTVAIAGLCALPLSSPAMASSAHMEDPEHLRARHLAATCTGCHNGAAEAAGGPSELAGRDAESVRSQLLAYRDGSIPATVMHHIVRGYSEVQLDLIADYFAHSARPLLLQAAEPPQGH